MKRVLSLVALILLFASATVEAQGQSLVGVGHEDLTVSTTAVSITTTSYVATPNATRCIILVEDADIRYSLDGSAPTSTVGHPALQDSTFIIYGEGIAASQFIRSGGSDAGLQIACYRGDAPLPDPTPKATLLSGVTSTAAELNQLDGLAATAAIPVMDGCTFTEDATNITHTCTVTVPANSWLIDIYVTTSVLWTDAQTSLAVGDVDSANGWFDDVDLAATDLLVGEQLSITDGGSWGGTEGTYLVAATGVRGQAVAAYASRYVAAASEVIGVVTMTTPTGAAGRSHMVVVYASPTLVAATAAP